MADEDLPAVEDDAPEQAPEQALDQAAEPAPVTSEPQTIGEAMGALEDAAVHGVDIDIVAVLGTAELKVSQILQLGRGAVVELDRLIGEPVDIRAERELVARGEVVVVEDKLAIQLTEVVRSSGTDT
ncbi:MAG: flagellar motor switch protein FliN [Rhodospirillaceae bacterium]|jgi:flagellar motor switch protein FliN/FliY|nr:flagellar motor switch protein FliN [Rhodospirillaceae bacterium]MBT4937625.1 flagellar motor switch protein FliN [Rhodospirillaceae bacterium]MBT7957184.1 flagellar motor switch protein FliN [Rhodospirillaceae bacterium]